MKKKPTILMIPSWYPTKENPFNGCFFREQALAMQKNFNFVVATYKITPQLAVIFYIKKILGMNKPKVVFVQNDNGLQEYKILAQKPQFIFWDLFWSRFTQIVLHKTLRPGVGKQEHHSLKNQRKYIVEFIKKKNLLPHFDCVYSLTAQDVAPLGKTFSEVFLKPHVTAEHAPFPWPGLVLTDSAVEAIESADKFLAISNDKIRQVMLQNIKINPFYVGNMVDESKFYCSKQKKEIKTFLIVAANSFYKNMELFIKAMEELKRIADKDFKIIIAGYNSNKGYAQNVELLEKRVKNSIIFENTTMIEAVSRSEMPDLYNSCDAFVMTSIQEGLPVSAIEASMCGLPVFSTRCGGVEDYIDNEMGRIYNITDYKGIANGCNDFLNENIKFDNLKIREKTINLFGKEIFVERISQAFFDVINKE